MKKLRNWAGTVSFETDICYPTTENEIIDIVKKCNSTKRPIKVIGKQHSYNNIFQPAPGGLAISLKRFNKIEKIDRETCTATFQAGATTPQLLKELQKEGLTLSNLGTNIMDNYAGACSTGYHGSGIQYGIQSTYIQSMEFIAGNGEKMTVTPQDPLFQSLGVGIGAFGIIIRLTIKCEPSFNLHMVTWKTSIEEIEKKFPSLLHDNEHFKFMWTPHTDTFQVWTANRTKDDNKSYWKTNKMLIVDGLMINNLLHEALLYPAYAYVNFTKSVNGLMEKLLIPKHAELTFTSYWVFFLPHFMKQTAMEYAFPIEDTFPYVHQFMKMIDDNKFIVQTPVEVRFVKKDDFWLSPRFGYIASQRCSGRCDYI